MTGSSRFAALGAALGLVLLVAAPPAQASPDTLKRSIQNMTMAPFDFALSPVVAGNTIYRNLNDIEDSRAVRIVYPVPGYFWTTTIQMGAAVLRGVTGVIEFLPGLGLLFFENDLDPMFDPAEDNEALVDYETPVMHIRMGIDYTTAPF